MTINKKKFEKRTPNDEDSPRVSPRDMVGSLLLINVIELREGVKTKFSPDGARAINVDVASVETGNVVFDQLWFNGALVDSLADYVDSAVPCRIKWSDSASSGYQYLDIEELASEADELAVDKFIDANPNIFVRAGSEAPADPAPAKTATAPRPASKPRW